MINNAYIHIPFCKSKCGYCSFTSFVNLEMIESFFKALEYEILHSYKGEPLNTLYFGGGTPSIIPVKFLNHILSLFNLNSDAEITLECNPDDIDENFINNIHTVNRISLGCQTFDDNILKIIGRRHNGQKVIEAVNLLNKKFNNISLDFIYGLPNQTEDMFLDDIKNALKLNIQHISLYGLKLEKKSTLYGKKINIADLDTQAQMYIDVSKLLTQNGFNHYEISNFAISNFESKHNLNYWNCNTYYGFGCGASGYEKNTRYTNSLNLKKYINNPLIKSEVEVLSKKDMFEEELFLGFRKFSGINTENLRCKFSVDFDKKYSSILKKYDKYFEKTDIGWKFNLQGMLISDEILSEML